MQNIRNFSIIAHIDHGKSTLSDRILEITGAIAERDMSDQLLDTMELEQERGITIKMQPARMNWQCDGQNYILNLIDTPGHIDFSYEVSRAMHAVEGCLLLVDSTQGLEAQTFTVLDMARENNLVIIPVITKIDSPLSRRDDIVLDICELLGCDPDDVLAVSGKTGDGVRELLNTIIEKIPAPVSEYNSPRAMVFDYEYSNHTGIIVYARIMDGVFKKGDTVTFRGAQKRFTISEVGTIHPKKNTANTLSAGEIGYIVTGIKDAAVATVGDTITNTSSEIPVVAGYQPPTPMIWASVYPESADNFADLRTALARLKLSDSSLSFEEETSGLLGRGFRCGFLGMLHLEIISERLKREYNLELVFTQPTVIYRVVTKRGITQEIYNPSLFPDFGDIAEIYEPWVMITVVSPESEIGSCLTLINEFEGVDVTMTSGKHSSSELRAQMPARELMRNFFDELKSRTSGFASLVYEPLDYRLGSVVRLDISVNAEAQPAFTKVVAESRLRDEAEAIVEKLHKLIPRQQIIVKIQASAKGKVVSSRQISAITKDVAGYLYGGDISRKMKLRDRQKEGKKQMQARGSVDIPSDVFLKMMK
jgi:GTP-binding protein LepA